MTMLTISIFHFCFLSLFLLFHVSHVIHYIKHSYTCTCTCRIGKMAHLKQAKKSIHGVVCEHGLFLKVKIMSRCVWVETLILILGSSTISCRRSGMSNRTCRGHDWVER